MTLPVIKALPPAHPSRSTSRPSREEVHVWSCQLDTDYSLKIGETDTLSAAERDQAARFHFEQDRVRFVRRRRAIREILANYLDVAEAEVSYGIGAHGKPRLADRFGNSGIDFNASHSDEVAIVAVGSNTRLGVDIEKRRDDPEFLAIARYFFSTAEMAALMTLEESDRIDGFFRAWTRKEAVLKGVGRGLSLPLASFDVTLGPDEPAKIIRWEIPAEPQRAWTLHHLDIAVGYFAALVVDRVIDTVVHQRWQMRDERCTSTLHAICGLERTPPT